MNISRRGILKGAAFAGAAALLDPTGRIVRRAAAQTAIPSAVVLLHLAGGYNALFNSSSSFLTNGLFGVTSSNIRDLGNGLFVDSGSLGALNTFATTHMATIGINHGDSNHSSAVIKQWNTGTRSYPLMLANAMGGTTPMRCAIVGTGVTATTPLGPTPTENGLSMQKVTDMSPIIAALGGSSADLTVPSRLAGSGALKAARTMSAGLLASNGNSLGTVKDGYDTSILMLDSPTQTFDYAELAAGYGQSATVTSVNSNTMTTQLMAAELLIKSGCKVVIGFDTFSWDSHGDASGSSVRSRFASRVLPGLQAFVNRMVANPNYNVTVVITGDFVRSTAQGSDHGAHTGATVIGRHVKVGTTGQATLTAFNRTVTQSDGGSMVVQEHRVGVQSAASTPAAYWAYLAALAQVPGTPFGTNPHAGLAI